MRFDRERSTAKLKKKQAYGNSRLAVLWRRCWKGSPSYPAPVPSRPSFAGCGRAKITPCLKRELACRRWCAAALDELGIASVPVFTPLAEQVFAWYHEPEKASALRAALDALLTRGASSGTEAALFEAIFANPADELVRIVFDDWLQEQGTVEAADYIRRSVSHGVLERRNPLRKRKP